MEVDDGNGGTDSRTETVEVTNPPLLSMNIPIVSGEGGYINNIGTVYLSNYHMVGDNLSNYIFKSFISFDIPGLGGAEIVSERLTCSSTMTVGNLTSFKPLWVSSVYWAPDEIVDTDFNLSGDPIDNFSTANFMSSAPKLKLYLKNAINSGKDRFQIMMFFTGMATDNDNSFDYWSYNDSGISLDITYNQ